MGNLSFKIALVQVLAMILVDFCEYKILKQVSNRFSVFSVVLNAIFLDSGDYVYTILQIVVCRK